MRRPLASLLLALAIGVAPAAAADSSGGAAPDSSSAIAPSTPRAVTLAIAAANRLVGQPYRWGGGHASFHSRGYDCSGSVSYVLHAAGQLSAPLDSTGLSHWGRAGRGRWITVYANRTHAFMVIAGRRFDTSGSGGSGPRWRSALRSTAGFVARHPAGL
jgi:hypothetical protein